MKISIEVLVESSQESAFEAWTSPEAMTQWNFASDDWCCPRAEIDLEVGGKFCARMEAKDGSFGFDFEGTYTKVDAPHSLEYSLGDDRRVQVEFLPTYQGIRVKETFEAEDQNTAEQQRAGWLEILKNFKAYVEAQA